MPRATTIVLSRSARLYLMRFMLYLDDFRKLWVINGLCDVLINHLRFSLSPLGAMMKLVVLIHGCEWFTVSIERNDVDVDGVFCGSIGCDYHGYPSFRAFSMAARITLWTDGNGRSDVIFSCDSNAASRSGAAAIKRALAHASSSGMIVETEATGYS